MPARPDGDHHDHLDKVEDAMRDSYAFLDAGFRVTATGNSDAHTLTFHEPGVPRSFVAVPNDAPAGFDERASARSRARVDERARPRRLRAPCSTSADRGNVIM